MNASSTLGLRNIETHVHVGAKTLLKSNKNVALKLMQMSEKWGSCLRAHLHLYLSWKTNKLKENSHYVSKQYFIALMKKSI